MLCAALAAACTVIGAQHTGKPLHIGVDLPLSGEEAGAGQPALDGVRFYVQRHPTLDGFDLSLISADDATGGKPSPDQGVADVIKFLSDPNLVAMIGPLDASVARKEIPIANAAGLAMVSPATSSPCLTRDVFLPATLNPARTPISCSEAGLPAASTLRPSHVVNFFRLSTTDDLQGAAAADFAFKTLHLLKVAVISDHETYGQGLAAAFTARLQSLGGTVPGRLTLDRTTQDATSFLKAMKDDGAQAIYFGGGTAEHGCTIRAEMQSIFPLGEATPFFSGDGIADDPDCVRQAGANAAGIYATVPIVDASSLPAAAPTIRAYRASFGRTADYGPYTMPAYDATAIVYAALQRAIQASGGRLPARAEVTAQVAATANFAGTTGTIGFDPDGDTTNRIVSLFAPAPSDPWAPWKLVSTIDYRARPPS